VNYPHFFRRGPYPFESPFGILASMAGIYSITPREVFRGLGIMKASPLDLYNYSSKFEVLPVARHNTIIEHFPSAYRFCSFRKEDKKIKFCVECMAVGFHSVFFCLPQVAVCVTHNCILLSMCNSCMRSFFDRKNFASVSEYCEGCCFSLPRPVNQLAARDDAALRYALFAGGSNQRHWFKSIVDLAELGDFHANKLDRCSSYTNTDVLNLITSSPRRLPKNPYPLPVDYNNPSTWVRWCGFRIDRGSTLDAEFSIQCKEQLQHIVSGILAKHAPCLRVCEQYLVYWDGVKQCTNCCFFCLIYLFMRLRFSVSSFRVGRDINIQQLSLSYFLSLISSGGASPCQSPRVITVYYYKLLGEIHAFLNQGLNVRLLIQPGSGMLHDVISSYDAKRCTGETFIHHVSAPFLFCNAPERKAQAKATQYSCCREGDNIFYIVSSQNSGAVVEVKL